MKIQLAAGDALVAEDVQNDFLPGGSLAVPGGGEVVPVLNRYVELFVAHGLPVFATRDWHPADHCSFREQGGPWPPHCVQGTPGAAFSAEFRMPSDARIISKADRPEKEAYSSFEDTNLDAMLRAGEVRRVFVGGLATDYCVLNTVKDALGHGYATYLLLDAVRAVNVQPTDGLRAVQLMSRLGAVPIRFDDLAA